VQLSIQCFLSLAALWIAQLPLQAASLTASFDRTTITAGESAVLSLTFEGSNPGGPPAVPSQPNLTIQYAGQSSQFTIVNGQTSSSLIYSYRVTPSQPGDYVIPPVQAVIDNKPLSTPRLRLKVVKASDNVASGGVKHALIRLIVPKTDVYVGEVFPVEVQLYVQNAQNMDLPQLEAEGFTLGAMPKQPDRSQVQSGNAIYNVYVFKVAASAVKTGKLTLGPAKCNVVLRYRKARDPADVFDFFGGGAELRQVHLASDPQMMDVLPLPSDNKPESFNGAIGQFSFAVSASPTNVIAGDPITMKIQIAGTGTLDALPFPSQGEWRDIKTYPPTSKVEITDVLGMAGVKTFEQVIIPQNSEVKELPAIAFSYFDPEKKAYQTQQHRPIPITVSRSTAVQPRPTVVAEGPPAADDAAARDIVHIKPTFGSLGQIQPPLVRQTWFLLLQAVPLAVWISALVWRKRQEALANNPRLQRRLRVAEFVRNGLEELHALAAANQTEEFFAVVFRLLQEQLGERLNLPASSITEAVADEHLPARGASPDLIERLHNLFAACNQARYAQQRTAQELMSIVPQVEAALRELLELPDETSH